MANYRNSTPYRHKLTKDNKQDDFNNNVNNNNNSNDDNNNRACPCHEGILKRKGIALLIPNLGARRCCLVNFTFRPCLPQ